MRTIAESGISADTVVYVFYSINRFNYVHKSEAGEAGCEMEYLRVVDIPDTVTEVEAFAFEDCWELVSVTIPDCANMIDWAAFRNCCSLKSIRVSHSLTSIGPNAFL